MGWYEHPHTVFKTGAIAVLPRSRIRATPDKSTAWLAVLFRLSLRSYWGYTRIRMRPTLFDSLAEGAGVEPAQELPLDGLANRCHTIKRPFRITQVAKPVSHLRSQHTSNAQVTMPGVSQVVSLSLRCVFTGSWRDRWDSNPRLPH